MNISKDGKTLYFSNDEIENETNGEKKVFVTKRINGKESHIKAEKKDDKHNKKRSIIDDNDTFDFENEIVLGVTNNLDDKEQKKINKKTNNKSKRKNNTNYKKETNHPRKIKKKNKKVKKVIFKVFAIILIFTAITIFALVAPIFNITNIEVNGNNEIQENTIISLSGLTKGQNIFRFNNQIINNIKENTYINNVEIKRKLPGTIIINIEEREIKYQINLINSYVYIDKNGYILENSTIKKEVPIIVGLKITEGELINKKRLDTEDLERLIDITKIIDSAKAININNIITEIKVEDEDNYILYLESKNKRIYLGDTSNLTNKMLYVQKILENEEGKSGIAFVNGDIREGFKPYFREE